MDLVLGGEVTTQFVYRPELTSFETALAAVKQDQEDMCGYELLPSKMTHLECADDKGRFVEVFVTFSPLHEMISSENNSSEKSAS